MSSRAIVSIVTLACFLIGCGEKPPQQGPAAGGMPAMPVPVAEVIQLDLPTMRELTGRIEAIEAVELMPRVSGAVERVLVADGADVKAGQIVLEIDAKPLRAALARAEADVTRADARAAQARQQLQRGEQLLAQKLISPQQHDDLGAAVSISAADVVAAKAAVEVAALELGYTQVAAPIAGRLGDVLISAGDLVQGGGPMPGTLLTTIVAMDPVDVVFDLDEATWNQLGTTLDPGKAAVPVPVNIGLAGEEGHPHAGAVRFVDNHVDSASGSIRLRAALPNPKHVLTPGAFARVLLQIAPPKAKILVNERAVLSQLATRFVLVIDATNHAQFRPVRLGGTEKNGLRVVEEGLSAGERIAAGGVAIAGFGSFFFPGMEVMPMEASMETLELKNPPPSGPPGAAAEAPAAADGKKQK